MQFISISIVHQPNVGKRLPDDSFRIAVRHYIIETSHSYVIDEFQDEMRRSIQVQR